jgi:RimJ/RimL family protein N-acetyltransferase
MILRTVTMEDVDDVARGWRMDGEPIPCLEARERVQSMIDNHSRNVPGSLHHLCLAMVAREGGEIIGWCGLDHQDKSAPHPVLFYLLKEEHRGRGLATEAAVALLRYGFSELGLAQIDGGAAADNAASKRVMEKIGMHYVGLNDEGGHAFTVTREEFLLLAPSH